MLDFQAARWLMDGEVPKQAGNNHPTSIPTGVFKTSDGHINIATTGQAIWERFCEAIERAGADGASPNTRPARRARSNRDALNAEIDRDHGASAPAPNGSSASTTTACRAGRSTRSTRCSPIRRSSISASRRASRSGPATLKVVGPAGDAVAHAEQGRGAAARSSASTPTRCWRNSASAEARSPRCARRTRCEARSDEHGDCA